MIAAVDVDCSYGAVAVLRRVSLRARSGEVVGLIGPNGSGKTTLLRTLYAAMVPDAGYVTLDDDPLARLRPAELARRLGVVAQDGPTEMPVTVAETVLLGRSPHRGSFRAWTAQDHRLAAAALTRTGVRHLADRTFGMLSGGERQRVLIARTLAQDAAHLLLDEPTNHLDIHYQHQILSLVRGLPVTTVVVLHDLNLAARYCDSLVLLDRGLVVASGATTEVLRPEVLEPVYQVSVRRVDDLDCPQLLFSPAPDGSGPPAG